MSNVILYDRVLDYGLNALHNECDEIHVCASGTITDYTSAMTLSRGKKIFGAGNAFGAPSAGAGGGRIVASVAITNGTIDDDGTITQWCAVDSALQRVLAVGAIEGETWP